MSSEKTFVENVDVELPKQDHKVDVYQSLIMSSRKVKSLEEYVQTHILKTQFSSDLSTVISDFFD